MLPLLALTVALAPANSVLSPEATEHNTKAMVFYDAGQFAPAVDEFFAAYQSMPDARRHRAGRIQLLGSMRMTLLNLHDAGGEAAPLCRLQALLRAHVDALVLAYPDYPDMPETRAVREDHEEVTNQLTAFGPDVCKPPPPPVPVSATPPVTERARPPAPTATSSLSQPARSFLPTERARPPAPTATPPRTARPPVDTVPPHHLKIAGGVTLGLGVALLGGVVHGIVTQHEQRARAREFDQRQTDRFITRVESAELHGHLARAQFGRQLAIGTGVAAGVMTAMGTTLLVLARRTVGARRWSAAPWWSPAGAGLVLHVQLGPSR